MLLAEAHRWWRCRRRAERSGVRRQDLRDGKSNLARTVQALVLAAETAWQARRNEETLRWVNRGMEAARAAGEKERLKELLSLGAMLANLRGEYEKANQYSEEAMKLAPAGRESQVQEEVSRGGKLVVAMASPVKAKEPIQIELLEEEEILANVFETLLATDQEGNLVPALCEKWEVTTKVSRSCYRFARMFASRMDSCSRQSHVKQSFERAIGRARERCPQLWRRFEVAQSSQRGKAETLPGLCSLANATGDSALSEPLSLYPALFTDYKTGITSSVATMGPFRARDRFALLPPGAAASFSNEVPDYWKGTHAALSIRSKFRPGLSASAIATGLRSE